MAMENPTDMDLANNYLPSSRSSTPTMTNCERQQMVNQDLKKFSIMLSNVTHTIECITPFAPDDDPDLAALYSRQAYFDERRRQAIVYIPPRSDGRLFTHDLEQLLQTNSNCVIFGDLNATYNEWNCSVNSTRGNQLKTFTDNLNLTIAYPNSPTRFGYSTSAVTTCWSEFRNNLKKSVWLSDFSGIRNPNVLEEKISLLTVAVCSAHHQGSKSIENRRHSERDIHDLIYLKNKAKRERLYNRTRNLIHRTNYYRALKKSIHNTPGTLDSNRSTQQPMAVSEVNNAPLYLISSGLAGSES
ncbi:hypothetical protein TNCV_4537041 [Trichonephila clavipes]|nr:hypothetical protein TNCV_4537041 [Trichonephila clavipes]